jgi:hypothetical protein
MKKVVLFFSAAIFAISCSQDDIIQFQGDQPQSMTSLVIEDPVIAYFSPYGSIQQTSSEYEGQNCPECTDHAGIYMFIPDGGPLHGVEIEVYRYNEFDDIPGACDASFKYEKRVHEMTGGGTSTSCPVDGNDCKYVDASGVCVMVFCDESV